MKPEIDMGAWLNDVENAIATFYRNKQNNDIYIQTLRNCLDQNNYETIKARLQALHVKNIEELLK
jgi:hypothetical protein